MASWSKDRVEPNAINGGREFTRDDNLAVNELNAIVNNSFYASEKSAEALSKINDIIEHEQGTVVTINDSPQAEWKADFAESERQKSKNLWNSELQSGAYAFADGRYFEDVNYVCNKNLIPVMPNSTITISCKGIDNSVHNGFVFFKDGVFVSSDTNGKTTAIVPSNANQVAYNFHNENIKNDLNRIYDIQLEYGNTATDYQAYNGAIVHEKDMQKDFYSARITNSIYAVDLVDGNIPNILETYTFNAIENRNIEKNADNNLVIKKAGYYMVNANAVIRRTDSTAVGSYLRTYRDGIVEITQRINESGDDDHPITNSGIMYCKVGTKIKFDIVSDNAGATGYAYCINLFVKEI